MKILVLNGSPKAEKSDTMHLTRAFLDGMGEVQQNEVKIIHVIKKNIGYCKGCLTCMKNGGTCVLNDDMKNILQDIRTCNVLICSFPLYSYGMPAPLKNAIDRTIALSSIAMKKSDEHYEHITQSDFSNLQFVMICGCGFPNAVHNFEPAVMQFNMMFRRKNTILTVPESPLFNAPEAASVTSPFLTIVRQAGHEYAKQGAVTDETAAKLAVPMIPDAVYAKICNGGDL